MSRDPVPGGLRGVGSTDARGRGWGRGSVCNGTESSLGRGARSARLGVNALDPLELCAEPRLGGYLLGHVHFTAVEKQSLCSLEGRLRALGSYSPLRIKWEIPCREHRWGLRYLGVLPEPSVRSGTVLCQWWHPPTGDGKDPRPRGELQSAEPPPAG